MTIACEDALIPCCACPPAFAPPWARPGMAWQVVVNLASSYPVHLYRSITRATASICIGDLLKRARHYPSMLCSAWTCGRWRGQVKGPKFKLKHYRAFGRGPWGAPLILKRGGGVG